LKTLIRKEILADAEKYGDARRSPLVEREEAKALTERDLTPAEAVTVVLSQKGWVRAAKGHDVDGASLAYKAGDSFLAAAHGKSNQQVVFIDSSGRSFSCEAHLLPSARTQGEPLTGRFSLVAGETVDQVLMAKDEQAMLLASDAGYGFICRFADLVSRNKNGKAVLNLPTGAKILPPCLVHNHDTDQLVVVSNEGRMLIFPVKDLPELAKGKGNKMISIPTLRAQSREEYVVAAAVVAEGLPITLSAGKRKLTLKAADLEHYRGERGRRGNKLPRGLQRVDAISAEIQD
jgi:topoisomerase-4 subunit A